MTTGNAFQPAFVNTMFALVQGVLQAMACSKRDQRHDRDTKQLNKGSKKSSATGYVSTDSTNDLDSTVESLESSDTDKSSSEFPPDVARNVNLIRYYAAPCPPPGLESMAAPALEARHHMGTNARLFQPSAATVNVAPGNRQPPWARVSKTRGECSNANPSLHEVINKLSPEDAESVMNALNASVSQNPAFMAQVHQAQRQAQSTTGSRAFRPWTPFQQFPEGRGGGRQLPARKPEASTRNAAKQSLATHEGCTGSLRENLVELSLMDQNCVILVRKINKLGLDSAKMLETYFARFGEVKRVFVTHSAEKSKSGDTIRWRPAGIAFVVMEKVEDAAAAMREEEHAVLGVTILAGPYQDNHATKAVDQQP